MGLITEMERRITFLEDVTGELVPQMMKKAILLGILDPMTCQHTASRHTLLYDKLKPAVLEFASNAISPGTMPMAETELKRRKRQTLATQEQNKTEGMKAEE